jgi:hypothetical protein
VFNKWWLKWIDGIKTLIVGSCPALFDLRKIKRELDAAWKAWKCRLRTWEYFLGLDSSFKKKDREIGCYQYFKCA